MRTPQLITLPVCLLGTLLLANIEPTLQQQSSMAIQSMASQTQQTSTKVSVDCLTMPTLDAQQPSTGAALPNPTTALFTMQPTSSSITQVASSSTIQPTSSSITQVASSSTIQPTSSSITQVASSSTIQLTSSSITQVASSSTIQPTSSSLMQSQETSSIPSSSSQTTVVIKTSTSKPFSGMQSSVSITPSMSTTISNTDPSSEKGLGMGVIAALAIVAGLVVVIMVLVVVLIVACLMKRKQRRRKSLSAQTILSNGHGRLSSDFILGALSDNMPHSPQKPKMCENSTASSPAALNIIQNIPAMIGSPDSLAQPYEVPIRPPSMSSRSSSEYLAAYRTTNSNTSSYVVMEGDSSALQQFPANRDSRQENGKRNLRQENRNSRSSIRRSGRVRPSTQTSSGAGQYSILRSSAEYYRLLEQDLKSDLFHVQAAEGENEEPAEQFYAPPSSEEEILATLADRGTEMIPRNEIDVKTHLGSGQFGTVAMATWTSATHSRDVAVKTLTPGAGEIDKIKFLQEAAIMVQFRHPNVVQLHGVVIDGSPTMLVLEYLQKGDLRRTLMRLTRKTPPNAPQILLNFCQQVALGMHYLTNKGFVHRDLAARNIFLSDNDVCKVGDFGMSRDLADADYYLSHGGKIPVRWTAPEALYYRKYSSASDVWSYGCLLYEIWSLGRMPFKSYTNAEVIEKVDSGYRLPPSPGCPRVVYELMIKCWHPLPQLRPAFKDILIALLGQESDVLHIPNEDAQSDKLSAVLGSPPQVAEHMYEDLQQTYLFRRPAPIKPSYVRLSDGVSRSHGVYDQLAKRRYLQSFPTSSADIDQLYKDEAIRQSYRNTLLTSDTESDYEDIWHSDPEDM